MNEPLFVYGTLQDPKVQEEEIGRKIDGEPDELPDYKMEKIEGEKYPTAVRTNNSSEKIMGLVLLLTINELNKLDEYETGAYSRIKVKLSSGKQAWIYEKAQ